MKIILVFMGSLLVLCCSPVYSVVKQSTVREISSLYELKALVKTADKKIIFIDFYKDFCPPCEHFKNLYESWAHLFGKEILFIKVNTGEPEADLLCKEYEISSLPTLVVLDSQGKAIDKHVGMQALKKLNIGSFLAQVKENQQDI